jgi:hypothetical protein
MGRVASVLVVAIVSTTCCPPCVHGADRDKVSIQKKLLEDLPTFDISQLREKRLGRWKPDHENLTPILANIFRPKAEIVGDWKKDRFMGGSCLSIRKKASSAYVVDFTTFGSLDSWSLQREGTYKDGILRLTKAVAEYPGDATYDTLYAVSVGGNEYLISQASIRFLVKSYAKNRVVDWPRYGPLFAFGRDEKANLKISSPSTKHSQNEREPR